MNKSVNKYNDLRKFHEAFIDYFRMKLENLERGMVLSIFLLLMDTLEIYGVLQLNSEIRIKDRVWNLEHFFLKYLQITSLDLNAIVFMTTIYFFIIFNILASIYVIYYGYMMRKNSHLNWFERFLILPDYFISIFFNWVLIIPLT